MASLKFENLTKEFDGLVAVNNLNLSIKNGEFYVLLGPTGAGKTTSLRCLAGLDKNHQGQIYIGDENVSSWSPALRNVAMVFQQYSLYPHYTVRENLEFPLKSKIRNLTTDEIKKRVSFVAETLRITQLLDRKTDKLSGGEMQRVSIGRAIVRQPKAFLMDEPLSSLDAKLREALRLELKRLQKELDATLLYVTHDQVEAMSMADRIGIIQDGKLIQSSIPHEVYNQPKNVFVASFIGSPKINLFNASIDDGNLVIEGASSPIALEPETQEKLKNAKRELIVGIRPEDIFITRESTPSSIPTEVFLVENMGMENLVNFYIDQYHFKASVDSGFEVARKDKVFFRFDQSKLHFFDKETEENLIQPS